MNQARCSDNHELEIVSEGYGLCCEDQSRFPYWTAWRFTRPLAFLSKWRTNWIQGLDGSQITAWVSFSFETKQEAIDFITLDAEAYRNLREFDEERERARLMAV